MGPPIENPPTPWRTPRFYYITGVGLTMWLSIIMKNVTKKVINTILHITHYSRFFINQVVNIMVGPISIGIKLGDTQVQWKELYLLVLMKTTFLSVCMFHLNPWSMRREQCGNGVRLAKYHSNWSILIFKFNAFKFKNFIQCIFIMI